jgi:hypothetical protein
LFSNQWKIAKRGQEILDLCDAEKCRSARTKTFRKCSYSQFDRVVGALSGVQKNVRFRLR